MSVLGLPDPKPTPIWIKLLVAGLFGVAGLALLASLTCPSLFIPSRKAWKAEVHDPSFSVDFKALGPDWRTSRLELLHNQTPPLAWIYLSGGNNDRYGIWIDLATNQAKPARDTTGRGVAESGELIINGGESRIDHFGPQVWELGQGLSLDGVEERVDLSREAHLLLSGEWHERVGHYMNNFLLGEAGPHLFSTTHPRTFSGWLTLEVKGQTKFRQRVQEWDNHDFGKAILCSGEGDRADQWGRRNYGTYLVVVEGSDYHPDRAWGFRISE